MSSKFEKLRENKIINENDEENDDFLVLKKVNKKVEKLDKPKL